MTPEERARACCDTRDAEEVESRMVPADLQGRIAAADAIAAGRLGIAIGDWCTTGPGSPFATLAPRDPPPTAHTPPEE